MSNAERERAEQAVELLRKGLEAIRPFCADYTEHTTACNGGDDAPCDCEGVRPRAYVDTMLDLLPVLSEGLSSPPVAPNPDPRCPKCGFTMCEQFNERPVTALASVATPNGDYRCYHCSGVAPVAPHPYGLGKNAYGSYRFDCDNCRVRGVLVDEDGCCQGCGFDARKVVPRG